MPEIRIPTLFLSVLAALALLAAPAAARKQKVEICHKPGTRAEKTLRVPEKAAKKHVEKHGDRWGSCERSQGPFEAKLTGYEEVPTVSTTGRGTLVARLDAEERTLDYRLTYADLEGDIRQAHIHFGQPGVNGGVVAWLCADPGNLDAPAGTPSCEGTSGQVSGEIEPEDVVGPDAQGIEAGEFAEALRALRAGLTYVNVHSARFPGGEVRGQLD